MRLQNVADNGSSFLAEDQEVRVHRAILTTELVINAERPLLARIVPEPAHDIRVRKLLVDDRPFPIVARRPREAPVILDIEMLVERISFLLPLDVFWKLPRLRLDVG